MFDSLPVHPGDIVFFGNSITDGCNFEEFFPEKPVKNRGISGDVIPGLLDRLSQVTDGKPAKIFLLVGINDVSHNLSAQQVAQRYERLLDSIQSQTPSTQVFVQSVMPINNVNFSRYKTLKGKENTVKELNSLLKKLSENKGYTFIDLTAVLADPKTGRLRKDYTNDGLHLLGAGNKAWIKAITPYINQ